MNAKEARQLASVALETKYETYFSKIEQAAKEGHFEVIFSEIIASELIDELREQRNFSVVINRYAEMTKISW